MKFWLITNDKDTLVGMRLAGIEGELVNEKDELLVKLENAVKNDAISIVLINNELASLIPSELYEIKKNSKTLIVEIPDKGSSGPADSITRYVANAVGIKI